MNIKFRLLGVALILCCCSPLLLCPQTAAAYQQFVAPNPPTGLSATLKTIGNDLAVTLSWNSAPGARYYRVERDSQNYGITMMPDYADYHTARGQTYTYSVISLGPTGTPSAACAPITVTVALPPAAPAGLSANGVWVTDCPTCKMPMAHVVLAWTAVSGATGYTLFRNGAVLAGVASPGYTDMAVTSGDTYTYTVTAQGAGGSSAASAAASATAPNPPVTAVAPPAPTMPSMPTMPVSAPDVMPAGFTAPANLEVHGVWNGGPTDTLSWDSVPGADSYNVYQYGNKIASDVTGTSYTVPLSQWNGSMTYTVTAVDSSCACESIPSAITMAQGAQNPNSAPGWEPGVPTVPTNLTATPDWNGGAPRVVLAWQGNSVDYTYNVYRDGTEVASGLWRLVYIDNNVQPGSTHTYTVTGVNVPWTTAQESAQSAPVTATALTAQPPVATTPVEITGIVPDDDSALVSFAAVPGAKDYRIYDVTNPGSVKYSGGGLSIEMNNLTPGTTANLVVQALDKLGPFQTSDGTMGPGSTTMSGGMNEAVNGQGDPSDLPNVIASSGSFAVNCVSQALTGPQAFYDNFMNDTPLEPTTLSPALAAVSAAGGGWYDINEVTNNNWNVFTYGADTQMSTAFIMDHHFMDTLYDGPTAATHSFSHESNASTVMMPKATADISGGKVLHVSFEVDAHFSARRWVDVFVTAAGQPLISSTPTKLAPGAALTPDDNDFYWQIQGQTCDAQLIQPQSPGSSYAVLTDLFDLANGVGADDFSPGVRTTWNGIPELNGTVQDLDKRHRFDLYLSQTHFRVTETVLGQPTVVVKDEDFPNGMTIPFTDCQVYFVHELYHTGNDRQEQVNSSGGANAYWYNNRPWSDERHWDDMGFEVLNSFPSLPTAN